MRFVFFFYNNLHMFERSSEIVFHFCYQYNVVCIANLINEIDLNRYNLKTYRAGNFPVNLLCYRLKLYKDRLICQRIIFKLHRIT